MDRSPQAPPPVARTGADGARAGKWKAPLPQYIEHLHEKRFGRTRPAVVTSVEERARALKEKMAARKAEKLQRDEEGRQPEEPSATWEEAVDARPEVSRLFSNLKHSLPALEKLLDESSSHWGYYNTKRSGTFTLGGRGFQLRRVAFPPTPTPEWYVVDLFENFAQAGVSRSELTAALKRALAARRFDAHLLRETAERYATRATKALSPAAPR